MRAHVCTSGVMVTALPATFCLFLCCCPHLLYSKHPLCASLCLPLPWRLSPPLPRTYQRFVPFPLQRCPLRICNTTATVRSTKLESSDTAQYYISTLERKKTKTYLGEITFFLLNVDYVHIMVLSCGVVRVLFFLEFVVVYFLVVFFYVVCINVCDEVVVLLLNSKRAHGRRITAKPSKLTAVAVDFSSMARRVRCPS